MVVAETIAGLSAVKSAFELTKAIKDLDDRTRRNAAVIELQESILSAQAAQATLIEKVRELEAEVARMKTWDAEKQRYELKDLRKGFFAYIPKEGMESGETPHAICTNCYQKGFKSILQNSGHAVVHDRSWDCPSCKSKMKNQSSDMAKLIQECRASSS
jgi:Zn finger protein HypA/HybF involved in hydrogenase expression